MNIPKTITIHNGVIIGEIGVISAIQNIKDMTYFSEEHIREVADSLGMSGDAFIAQLNGISYAEWMKGGKE